LHPETIDTPTSSSNAFGPLMLLALLLQVTTLSAVTDDGHSVEVGGHARTRLETWTGFGFGAPAGEQHSDSFLLGRVVAHADVRFDDGPRIFLEGKGAWATDRDLPGGTRPLDEDPGDLQQGFLELELPGPGGAGLTARLGRFQLGYGAQRLVSPLPWGNTLRHWDGGFVRWQDEAWELEAFVTNFVPVDPDRLDERDEDVAFHGLHFQRAPDGGDGLNLYAFHLDRASATYNGTTGSEQRTTVGARLWRAPGECGVDYDVELAYQTGEVGAADVSAYMLGAVAGWRHSEDSPCRLWVGLDYGSGDEQAGGDVETFQQLFPLGHAYLGITDTVGRQNVLDVSTGIDLTVAEDTRLSLAVHSFRLADGDDALYNAGGGIVRPGGTGSRDVGNEISLVGRKKLGRGLALEIGYARFFAGDVIEDSGPSDDIGFLYTQLLLSF
jgi:hypothetical protein